MIAPLFVLPIAQPLDNSGKPMPGCYIQFYAAETTTPQDVYADAAATTPLANPVPSNSAGWFPPIRLDPRKLYRVQLYNAAGELQLDVDNIIPVSGRFIGEVIAYDGDLEDIPAGWQLMNGDNGARDARGRTLVGVDGTKELGDTGGSETASGTTSPGGSHNHGGQTDGHALTEAEGPPHNHRLYGQLSTIRSGGAWPSWYLDVGDGGSAGNTYSTNGPTSTQMVEDSGDGDPHAHDIAEEDDHTHTLTGLSVMPPWLAVHWIKFVGA